MNSRQIIILLLGIALQGAAQNDANLVFNPSFEEHSFCPQRIDALGVMKAVDAWWQPTRGSSDYFHACAGRECATPRNKMGYQTPHTGDGYCGIYCSQADYREYLQTELREPLRAGVRYRVAFFVSLADKAPHAVATMGCRLSAERLDDSTMGILMQREKSNIDDGRQSIATLIMPQVLHSADTAITDRLGWTEVCDTIVAEGGERFLTIGNFFDFNHSGVVDAGSGAVLQGAYYYVDDVSVVCLDSVAVVPTTQPTIPAPGDVVTMWGVFFDVDSHELLPQSYNELHRLLRLLEENPSMKIELRGHTDNTGTRGRNQTLSQQRAEAVADYLVAHGVARLRVTAKGFGGTLPVADNDTPEGRAANRRVEYKVEG